MLCLLLPLSTTATIYRTYKYRCPVVFCVSNNDLCISFKNKGWAGEDGPLLKRMGATMEVHTFAPHTRFHPPSDDEGNSVATPL
jgi:hypothetical protein